ncbi:MAG TPA: HTH domain-containing protein [Paludibacteraceae bacterium]|nr:HTH domain-containing protein [Paludibacteraceae bacterium]HPS10223.1 HTH domain-containing protein [Paludibacteraceae bacterium]
MDQPKLERLLRVMKMLTANNSLTVDEIADQLSISPRSVYRYIDTFREAGFVIKKKNNCIKLDKSSPYFKDISDLLHFSPEEAYILKEAIESIDENNVLKQNLKKKLYTVYNYNILAETIVNGKNGRNVERLVDAIESRRPVILRNYSSAHGNDIRDRCVEAFAFTTNYVQVWCYCPDENCNKLFKVSRIGSVDIQPGYWKHTRKHKTGKIDIFRMNSSETFHITLKLGLRAMNLLVEEFPLAAPQLRKLPGNQWLLDTDVCSPEGVGRFVMGLPEDIEIINSPELRDYIVNNLVKMKNKYFVS